MMTKHLSFMIRNKTLLVVSFLIMNVLSVQAQDSLRVRGVVKTINNQPLANISVSIEGSYELPAVTDEAGKFVITAPSGNCWLIVSPASDYKKKRVFLNNRKSLEIFFTPDDISSGDDVFSILSKTVIK